MGIQFLSITTLSWDCSKSLSFLSFYLTSTKNYNFTGFAYELFRVISLRIICFQIQIAPLLNNDQSALTM